MIGSIITKIENLPDSLTQFYYSNNPIKFVDNVPLDWFNGKFTLRWYQTIKKLQRRMKRRYLMRNKSALIIQRGCHDWIWKPILRDGKNGIRPRLDMNHLIEAEILNHQD